MGLLALPQPADQACATGYPISCTSRRFLPASGLPWERGKVQLLLWLRETPPPFRPHAGIDKEKKSQPLPPNLRLGGPTGPPVGRHVCRPPRRRGLSSRAENGGAVGEWKSNGE
ncbi:hypothetical protein NL676_002976 [Syzygium grande]|nr:hypothetical protein NL676_002976 [Syzygium grande]